MPVSELEKLHHTFIKKGVPNKLENNTLIAKVNEHSVVIEYDSITSLYRIMVLTDVDLNKLENSMLVNLLSRNFDFSEAKIAADPENYLITIMEIEEKCIKDSFIEVFLEKMNKLINYTEHVIKLLSYENGER